MKALKKNPHTNNADTCNHHIFQHDKKVLKANRSLP